MSATDSPLTVVLEGLGRSLTHVKSWSINSAFLVPTDQFEFVAFDNDRTQLFDLELQPVNLLVGGASQLLGRIEVTEIGGDGTSISCSGRDYLCDLIECNVDPTIKVKENDELGSVIQTTFAPMGIQAVISDDDVLVRNVRSGVNVKAGKGGKRFAKRLLKEYKPKPGEGAFEFVNRLVARFGCTVQPGPDRETVALSAPNYNQEPIGTIYCSADAGRNNVITATARRDFSSFPTYALGNGWAASGASKTVNATIELALRDFLAIEIPGQFTYGSDELVRILDRAAAPTRRIPHKAPFSKGLVYRLLYIKDDEARTQEQLAAAVTRSIAERLKETLVYRATLRGHSDPRTGAIWSVDTIVQVVDTIRNVNEPLWIADRTLRYDERGGAMTDIVAIRPSTFTLG